MTWNREDPYKPESKKIVWEVAPYLRGRGLDIGAGDFKVLPHAISVDNMHHAMFGFQNKPDVLCAADKLDVFASQSMDFVYSSHTLEHVQDAAGALREWWRVVRVGGVLALYLPHKEHYPLCGTEGANPDHKHDFCNEDIICMMEDMPAGWDLLENQVRTDNDEYSMLLVFKKLNGKARAFSYKRDKPEKTACVVRYGAFGDLMQASSVFAGLKKQGFHVTVFTAAPGCQVIENDPNIDNMVVFDKDQVPNANLVDFWRWQKQKYDRWVNLSESAEGTLLAMPGRTLHFWPTKVRHLMMNYNYVELQHALADVPHELNIKFFATAEEKHWAKKEREKIGGSKVILWSLAGSSVHKTWAGLDSILASLMIHFPDCRVVLTGGPECVLLEAGWEQESRIHRKSGVWTIRQTLSFMQVADLVIGPETGVMNAAACEPMPKVVFLSHSSHENLTRDWVNTRPLASAKTACYPCHKLHFSFEHCAKDEESGTAQCQADISVEQAWDTIAGALE